VNFETIHTHDVDAERSATFGEVRTELAGERVSAHTSLRDWLWGGTHHGA
jgi:hypothetical protein